MTRTVLINRLKLAATLIGSRHSLSQRRGYSRVISIIDDLKQLEHLQHVTDFKVQPVLSYLSYMIKKDKLTYSVMDTLIKNQEASICYRDAGINESLISKYSK